MFLFFPALHSLQAADLPVHDVILYKHGVGFFARQGTLAPGEAARLDFRASEMDDVLKSLTVQDAAGTVKGLRYDSSLPIERRLQDFPFRIADGQPLSALLDQLKGARVELNIGSEQVRGSVVSAGTTPADKDHPQRERLTLLMDGGEFRNVELASVTSLRFSDVKLQQQFRDYLTSVSGARSKELRSVYIDSSDAKSRELRASYIIPMPAWKSSYRLLLDAAQPQSMLEGWAVVDNTTGEDWTNVRISLVSGKPISFISPLYEPKFISRQSADLPENEALAPTVHGGVMGGIIGGIAGGVPGGIPSPPPPPVAARKTAPFAAGQVAEMRTDVAMSSLGNAAAGTEVADLFEYAIRQPVTVRKNESAMLPFLQQKIGARKLIIYSDNSWPNPLNAAEISNSSGKTLDGGPITVFDGGVYAGEALVETVKAGDKRLVSYGVDLGTRISTNVDSRVENTREIHFRNGVLVTKAAVVDRRVYAIKNVDNRAKSLIIEHRIRPNYSLVDTPKPQERSRDAFRFAVNVPPSGELQFPVTEENVYETSTSINNLGPDILVTYIQNRNLGTDGRRQLEAVVAIKRKVADLGLENSRLDNEVRSLTGDQGRLRENIRSLSAVSGQQQVVQDYARKLAEQEAAIVKDRDAQSALEKQRTASQRQLNELIDKLNF